MPKLVALTGATGFIGNTLIKALLANGWQVRALTRRKPMHDDGTEWVQGDIHNLQALTKLVDGADAIIHCAGIVRGASATEFNHTNTEGTQNLIHAIGEQQAAPRFLLISSLAAKYPQYSWYAASKHEAENVLAHQGTNIPWAVYRPTAVYGPGDREIKPLLNAMRSGLLPRPGTGNSRISLIHIDDLVEAIIAWLSHAEPVTGVFELDDGRPGGYDWDTIRTIGEQVWQRRIRQLSIPIPLLRTLANINLLLARLFRYSPMLTPGKVHEITHPDWSCDNSALTAATGWQPKIELHDAMQEAAYN